MEAYLETDCIYWSAMYLFTDCEDPSGSCVASAADDVPIYLPVQLMMMFDNGPYPQDLYLAIDNLCDTPSSYDFGGRMTLSIQYDPCTGEEKGACCFTDNHCEFFSLEECLMAGGEFTEPGLACDPNPCVTTGVDRFGPSRKTELLPAMPNPFTHSTVVRYSLAKPAHLQIELFNAAGRVVRHLVAGQTSAGPEAIEWDRCDDSGSPVGPGIYFCRLKAGEHLQTRRVVVLQ